MHPARQSGVTLIGLMIGVAVGILVLAATLSLYLMIAKGARENIRQARLNQELRAALEVMQQDIRRAGYWDFADTNGDGDANGDGLFTWQDLGISADGSGTFDTDRDGQTDARDLHPLNNPFQRQYGRVNNDLCINTDADTGACVAAVCTETHASGHCLSLVQTGDCVTYSYDLDQDARIGIRACDRNKSVSDCPRPDGPPFDAAGHEPYAWSRTSTDKDLEMEMFGFRLRQGGIDMRTGRASNQDTGFGCNTGRWEAITSADIRITQLDFRLTTLIRNANPAKSRIAGCASGDLCQHIRRLDIRISGHIAGDPRTAQSVSALVAVRNDHYLVTP